MGGVREDRGLRSGGRRGCRSSYSLTPQVARQSTTKSKRNRSIPQHTVSYRTRSYHTIPYHTISYNPRSFHTIPYHTIPYHTVPCHTAQRHTIANHTIPYHTIPYHTIPYHTVPHHTNQYNPTPYHTKPYHTEPYHTMTTLCLDRIIPYHTIPYHNKPRPYPTAHHTPTHPSTRVPSHLLGASYPRRTQNPRDIPLHPEEASRKPAPSPRFQRAPRTTPGSRGGTRGLEAPWESLRRLPCPRRTCTSRSPYIEGRGLGGGRGGHFAPR